MRLIVILSQRPEAVPGDDTLWGVRVAFRFPVPVWARGQFANLAVASEAPNTLPETLDALRAGAAVERIYTLTVPKASTTAERRAALQQAYMSERSAFLDTLGAAPWQLYGASWDGTTWTGGGA